MSFETEFSACVDLLAIRLPARALYDLSLEEPISSFHASLLEITELNVPERLAASGIEVRPLIEEIVHQVLAEKGEPASGDTLFEWVDAELRNRGNPIREQVRCLLLQEPTL